MTDSPNGQAAAAPSLASILVVEDDAVSAAVIAKHLRTLGLANPVQIARDGDDAVAWLARHAAGPSGRLPALILLDRHLPGRDGLEVLRWIHAQPGLRSVPVLILTAASDVPAISEAYELGVRSYLVKPIGFKALGEVVRGMELRWAIVPPEDGR